VINRTTLDCGLRIITDTDATVRSASVGYFVNIGSRDEAPEQSGASHFLEHVLFKGTTRRTAKEISSSIENLGGGLNAYTTNEFTSFYAKVVDEDLPDVVDESADQAKMLQQKQLAARIEDKLKELPERERLVLALHYQQDLSFREVAYVMELTPGRISQLHTQALVRLRGMLAKEQEDSREE